MQICMNINRSASKELGKRLEARRIELGYRHEQIAKELAISQSQVSRACAGKFQTVSQTIMQICMFLDVEVVLPGLSSRHEERLTAKILKLWDRTPEGADRLLRLLDALDEVAAAGAALAKLPVHASRSVMTDRTARGHETSTEAANATKPSDKHKRQKRS